MENVTWFLAVLRLFSQEKLMISRHSVFVLLSIVKKLTEVNGKDREGEKRWIRIEHMGLVVEL